jgi:translation initiation factor 1
MSKPNKERIVTNAAANLTHNPFAALETKAVAAPVPDQEMPVEPASKLGRVVLRRETAHCGGKSVIVVDDFATHISLSMIEELSKKLRKACGCGGSVKDRKIELQGDQAEKIRALLQAEGFRVAGV